MTILHVTNGDSAARSLALAEIGGDILPWRDVLHDGPVPSTNDADELRTIRAEFLANTLAGINAQHIRADLAQRDARLDAATSHDAVVLWFEPDLYDQLQLIQILHRLNERQPHDRPHITIVAADCYLGPLDVVHFRPLYESRRTVSDHDLALGARAWHAFTSPSPVALSAVAAPHGASESETNYGYDSTARLPHLAAALVRQLQEFPDVHSGLSRSERQLCDALRAGPCTLAALFPRAHQAVEPCTFLGDSSFAWYVQRVSDVARPLLTYADGAPVIAHPQQRAGFWERPVQLTPFGLDVLQSREDCIAHNGIDRWIGGVHLTSDHDWRWDPTRHAVRHST